MKNAKPWGYRFTTCLSYYLGSNTSIKEQRHLPSVAQSLAWHKGVSYVSNHERAKRSEKGLLTQDNCVVALIDDQPQMLFGVSNFDRQTVINKTVALANATRVFDAPVVLSTVESKTFSGSLWPQITAVFPQSVPIERSSMNAWDDSNVVAAIEKTGRKKIVLAGQANSSRHFMRELNRLGVTSIIDAGGMFQNGCGSHSGQIFENLIEQAVEGYPIRGRGDAQNVD